jgi:hypothetical protein
MSLLPKHVYYKYTVMLYTLLRSPAMNMYVLQWVWVHLLWQIVH